MSATAEKFPYGNITLTVDFPEFEGCPELNKSIKNWLTEKCKYAEETYADTASGSYSLPQSRVIYSTGYIAVLFYEFVSTEESNHPYMARKSFIYNTETKKMVTSASEFISEKAYKKALSYVLRQKDTT